MCYCRRWKARSLAILGVLRSLDADFICLQELDEYDNFYKEKVEQHGYSSIYVKRSGDKCDGCGIFYKHNNFQLVIKETIDYNELANSILDGTSCEEKALGINNEGQENTQGGHEDPNDLCVRLKCDCVEIMAAFKLRHSSQHYVVVANTHLYWDPEWADVKLAQAKYLLSRVELFRKMVSEKFECTPSVVIAGDFNSVPGDKVYEYLVSGGSTGRIPLRSVYAYTRGEPKFTNCTPGFTGTLDYIFFSPSGEIEPVSYLELPEADSFHVKGGLPNYHHPSDHLPIGAEFVFV